MIKLLFLIVCSVWVGVVSAQTFTVNNLVDATADISGCVSGTYCNLRSAWSACKAAYSACELCTIILPSDATLNFDKTLEPLYLEAGNNIVINGGSNTIIQGEGFPSGPAQFLYYEQVLSASCLPSVMINDITITGFGSSSYSGGAIYFNGEGDLHLSDLNFVRNTAVSGGAIYLSRSTSGAVIERCLFDSNDAYNGGAITLHEFNENVIIIDSIIKTCSAQEYGGGISLNTNNTNIIIENTDISNCQAEKGGGISLYTSNHNIQIINTNIHDNDVTRMGGGIFAYNGNKGLNVTGSTISKCSSLSTSGGGIFLQSLNDNFLLENSEISQCSGAYNGGCLSLDSENYNATVKNVLLSECSSYYYGGGIGLRTNNKYAQFINTKIRKSTTKIENGGGIFLDDENDGAYIDNVEITDCFASGGGGITIKARNIDVIIKNTMITNCGTIIKNQGGTYVRGDGGGIEVNQGNDNLKISDTIISNCSAYNGGGIFMDEYKNLELYNITIEDSYAENDGGGIGLLEGEDIQIISSSINYCKADNNGGGLALLKVQKNILLHESIFTNNIARNNGGGVYSSELVDRLTVSGSTFANNAAITGNGGGIEVDGGNSQFTITDSNSGSNMLVVESEHPYINTVGKWSPYYRYKVLNYNAIGFIVQFDSNTEYGKNDEINIISSTSHVFFKAKKGDRLPGKDAKPLYITGNEFDIYLFCDSMIWGEIPKIVTATDNLFGYKIYVTPIMRIPGDSTVFLSNTAGSGKEELLICHILWYFLIL